MEKGKPQEGQEEAPGETGWSEVSRKEERARRAADNVARAKMLRIMGTYSYIGIEFGVAVALGWFAGNWLDEELGTSPWFRFLLMGLGLAAAFRDLFRLVRRTDLDRMDDP